MDSRMENISLGNGRYKNVKVGEWKSEKRVDLREWNKDKPTMKGISLTLMRWKNFVECFDQVDRLWPKVYVPNFVVAQSVCEDSKDDALTPGSQCEGCSIRCTKCDAWDKETKLSCTPLVLIRAASGK